DDRRRRTVRARWALVRCLPRVRVRVEAFRRRGGIGPARSAERVAGDHARAVANAAGRDYSLAHRWTARANRRRASLPRASDWRRAGRSTELRANLRANRRAYARAPRRRSSEAASRRLPDGANALVPAQMLSGDGRPFGC